MSCRRRDCWRVSRHRRNRRCASRRRRDRRCVGRRRRDRRCTGWRMGWRRRNRRRVGWRGSRCRRMSQRRRPGGSRCAGRRMGRRGCPRRRVRRRVRRCDRQCRSRGSGWRIRACTQSNLMRQTVIYPKLRGRCSSRRAVNPENNRVVGTHPRYGWDNRHIFSVDEQRRQKACTLYDLAASDCSRWAKGLHNCADRCRTPIDFDLSVQNCVTRRSFHCWALGSKDCPRRLKPNHCGEEKRSYCQKNKETMRLLHPRSAFFPYPTSASASSTICERQKDIYIFWREVRG